MYRSPLYRTRSRHDSISRATGRRTEPGVGRSVFAPSSPRSAWMRCGRFIGGEFISCPESERRSRPRPENGLGDPAGGAGVLRRDGSRVFGAVLRFETRLQPEERTRASRVAIEIGAEDRLGLVRSSRAEELGAEAFPDRVVPAGGLVVDERVLPGDRALPVSDPGGGV